MREQMDRHRSLSKNYALIQVDMISLLKTGNRAEQQPGRVDNVIGW